MIRFKRLSQKEIDKFKINPIAENSSDGQILEIDLKYPDELHKLHNDYPLTPKTLEISNDILLQYCSNIGDKYGIKVGGFKIQFQIQFQLQFSFKFQLQLYLSLEMKLTKAYRVLKFKQSDWLKKYIDFNTGKRKNAGHIFAKDLFKLMINSAYGKTMKNMRKRINARLVNNAKDYTKYTSKSSSASQKIFSKNFVTIHEIKLVLTLDKPIYVGFIILDLSKYFFYNFHYNYIKKHNAKLLFTDIDRLVYEVKTDDVYEDFYKDKHLFDLSNYPKDSKLFDPDNEKVISKMKDESKGKIIDQFVGLKLKMHSIKDVDVR